MNASAGPAVQGSSVAQFGVGAIDGKNIGAYAIELDEQPTADGAKVDMLATFDKAATWNSFTNGVARNTGDVQVLSWGASGTKTPGAFKTITQPFKVKLAIGKIGELPPPDEGARHRRIGNLHPEVSVISALALTESA